MPPQPLKLIVRNTSNPPRRPHTQEETIELSPHCLPDLSSRVNQLAGNLRLLERRYRANLKEGFDNKIKTYRLQAVTERKILKKAVEESHKIQEAEEIQEKGIRR